MYLFLFYLEKNKNIILIIFKTPEVNAAKFAKQLKEYSVSHEYRNRRLGLFPKLPGGDQQENGGLPECWFFLIFKFIKKFSFSFSSCVANAA